MSLDKTGVVMLPNLTPNLRKKLLLLGDSPPIKNHAAFDFIHCSVAMQRKVNWKSFHVCVLVLESKDKLFDIVKKARKTKRSLFICVIDSSAGESALFRSKCFLLGANMVTNDHHSLKLALNVIGSHGINTSPDAPPQQKGYTCPYCKMDNLSADNLWHHVPLFHINEPLNSKIECPLCSNLFDDRRRSFFSHLRNAHGPATRSRERRDGISTHSFALVVCRRPTDNKFLVVQESGNTGFWLPGGRVNVGETLFQAALRRTKEEAGIEIEMKGILKVEHSTYAFDDRTKAYNRMRVIFYAEPASTDSLPKSIPTYHSAGATFISLEELETIRLRADEPKEWFTFLSKGGKYYPLDVLECWKHDHRSSKRRETNVPTPSSAKATKPAKQRNSQIPHSQSVRSIPLLDSSTDNESSSDNPNDNEGVPTRARPQSLQNSKSLKTEPNSSHISKSKPKAKAKAKGRNSSKSNPKRRSKTLSKAPKIYAQDLSDSEEEHMTEEEERRLHRMYKQQQQMQQQQPQSQPQQPQSQQPIQSNPNPNPNPIPNPIPNTNPNPNRSRSQSRQHKHKQSLTRVNAYHSDNNLLNRNGNNSSPNRRSHRRAQQQPPPPNGKRSRHLRSSVLDLVQPKLPHQTQSNPHKTPPKPAAQNPTTNRTKKNESSDGEEQFEELYQLVSHKQEELDTDDQPNPNNLRKNQYRDQQALLRRNSSNRAPPQQQQQQQTVPQQHTIPLYSADDDDDDDAPPPALMKAASVPSPISHGTPHYPIQSMNFYPMNTHHPPPQGYAPPRMNSIPQPPTAHPDAANRTHTHNTQHSQSHTRTHRAQTYDNRTAAPHFTHHRRSLSNGDIQLPNLSNLNNVIDDTGQPTIGGNDPSTFHYAPPPNQMPMPFPNQIQQSAIHNSSF